MKNVLFSSWKKSFEITRTDIDELAHRATLSGDQRARICLHRTHADPVQEMIIAMTPHSYVRPHRQCGFEKSYVLIAGELSFYYFDDRGTITRTHQFSNSSIVASRFDAGQWHSVRTMGTNVAIYLETLRGPFHRRNTEWADWAPGVSDTRAIESFLMKLSQATPSHS